MIGVICEKITLRTLRLILVAAVLPWNTSSERSNVKAFEKFCAVLKTHPPAPSL